MGQTKNLCAQIPLPLFERVREEREQAEETTSQYIIRVLTDYYENKNNGGKVMAGSRTMAFQIPEELFQRIKAHLMRETARTGQKLTQKEFVLGLIEDALYQAELDAPDESEDPAEEDESDTQAAEEGEDETQDE